MLRPHFAGVEAAAGGTIVPAAAGGGVLHRRQVGLRGKAAHPQLPCPPGLAGAQPGWSPRGQAAAGNAAAAAAARGDRAGEANLLRRLVRCGATPPRLCNAALGRWQAALGSCCRRHPGWGSGEQLAAQEGVWHKTSHRPASGSTLRGVYMRAGVCGTVSFSEEWAASLRGPRIIADSAAVARAPEVTQAPACSSSPQLRAFFAL